MKKKIYFHIGYPKCGSKFLQKKLFPKIDNKNFKYINFSKINFFDVFQNFTEEEQNQKTSIDINQNFHFFFNGILKLSSEDFLLKKDILKKRIIDFFKDESGNKFLVSMENVLDPVKHSSPDVFKSLKRLTYLFDDEFFEMNYFCVFRKKEDVIPSHWYQNRQNYKRKGISFNIFYDNLKKKNNPYLINILKIYDYNKTHDKIRSILNNLTLFKFEELFIKKDFSHLSQYLNTNIDIDLSERVNTSKNKLLGRKNYLLNYLINKKWINIYRSLLFRINSHNEYKKLLNNQDIIRKYFES